MQLIHKFYLLMITSYETDDKNMYNRLLEFTMSSTKRDWTVGIHIGFYWIGMALTLMCLTLTVAGNTEFVYHFEHTRLPLSWVFAGLAVLAFVAAEVCHPADSLTGEAEDESTQLAPEWEAVEV